MKRTKTTFLSVLQFCSLVAFLWGTQASGSGLFDRGALLQKAGENAAEIQTALEKTPLSQREGIEFLLAHMPEHDLKSLSANFLLEHVAYAYKAWQESPWKSEVPKDIFLNNILPHVSINEQRDAWRKSFYERFKPLIEGIESPGLAAVRLNQQIYPLLGVKYSTKRKKADQSPFETMESGLASCTGLSILLIDACRAVGIPARFVGTPLWSDNSGNHSWVEVWDDGWHFTGAAEPSGDHLDQAWFIGRAAKADRDSRRHAIYAVSYQSTPQPFPMVWKRGADFVSSVNVTDRYTELGKSLPDGFINMMFRIVDGASGDRCSAPLQLLDDQGDLVFEGASKDERFDSNDHLTVPVKEGATYKLKVPSESGQEIIRTVKAESDGQLVDLKIPTDKQ